VVSKIDDILNAEREIFVVPIFAKIGPMAVLIGARVRLVDLGIPYHRYNGNYVVRCCARS